MKVALSKRRSWVRRTQNSDRRNSLAEKLVMSYLLGLSSSLFCGNRELLTVGNTSSPNYKEGCRQLTLVWEEPREHGAVLLWIISTLHLFHVWHH